MENPTNHDLHIMLARIEERQVSVVDKIDNIITWQTTHQSNDDKQFKELNTNINDMNKYGRSIAMVAGMFGAVGTWLWNKFTS